MFGLKDIAVDFLTGHPVGVILGLLVLSGLGVLLYWRTNPPLPRWLRIILGGLRIVAVLALIAALAEPVISFTRGYERPRRLAVLVDRSASMNRNEQGLARAGRVDSLLQTEPARRLRSACDITTYYFGSDLSERSGSVDGNATALGSILGELDRRELGRPSDYWLLFSDGNSNSGPRPVAVSSGLRVPITAIGMATAGEFADVAVAEVDYNTVMFVGQPTEIKAKLRWEAADPRSVQVQLQDSGRVVTESALAIEQEAGFADLVLSYVPTRPGQTLLSIRVPPLEGEPDAHNNVRTFSVKVLKSRVNVLLACENPDYEVGFLHRLLRQSDRYEVELMALGRQAGNLAGRFPGQQTELNRYDLVILYDPEPARLNSIHDLLRSYLAERGGGVWVFLGARYASGLYSRAAELLPFYPSQRVDAAYQQFHATPAEGELFHPAVRLADSRAAIRETWAGLPPFKMLVPCDQTATGGVVLAYASGSGGTDGRLPVMGYRRIGPGKVLAFAAAPLWTWGFETLSYGADQSPYANLVEGAVNWLTVQDDFDPVRIIPEQTVYRRGEPVRFDGFAFDPGFRPIPAVTGSVTLTRAGMVETLEADMLEVGEGELRGEFANVPPGEYTFEAALTREGQVLKSSRGRILVESYSAEEYDQQGDPSGLAALANATGGNYHEFSDFEAAAASFDLTPVTETVEKEFVLWGKFWLLAVFIAALAVEWGLRKFNHLL